MQTQAQASELTQTDTNSAPCPPPGMEAFDLQRVCDGAPVRTRDGTPAEFVELVDGAPPSFCLRVKLPQYPHPRTYCENGAYHSDGRADGIDLFIAKV